MNRHLLSLAGVLDVVFGPDGDFEGAPSWSPPLWYRGQWYAVRAWGPSGVILREWDCATETEEIPFEEVYLDLRIPTVAARLAGLCARALSLPGVSYSLSWSAHERGGYVLSRPMEQRPGRPYMAAWNLDGLPIRCYSDADAPFPPPVPVRTDRRSLEEFLAALTLALAPRIAALRSTP